MTDERLPELVTDLHDQITDALRAATKIDRPAARAVAEKVVGHLTDHLGGQLIYIPKNLAAQIGKRDSEIWNKFDGRNQASLAKEYKLSLNQIYKILKRVQSQITAKNQMDMFK